MVDTLLGAYYSGRAAVLALKYGTSFQICRALSAATVGAALMGSRKRTQRCLEAAHRAAAEDGSPIAAWYARTTHCTTVFLLDHEFRRCFELATELEHEWYDRRLRRRLGDRRDPPLQPRIAADARHDEGARRRASRR